MVALKLNLLEHHVVSLAAPLGVFHSTTPKEVAITQHNQSNKESVLKEFIKVL